MAFEKKFQITANMIDKTLLDSYCEWVWYNVTGNYYFNKPEVILPNGASDDDNALYHQMYDIPEYNEMCLKKFENLIISKFYYITKYNSVRKSLFPYYILIVSLGLLGNCLSTCVIFGTKLRYSLPSVYFGVLALSDNCYLITMLALRHLNLNTSIFQKVFGFLMMFCSCMSPWIVVIFTVDRFIAIKWPLRRMSFCTVARAKIVIIILTIIMFLVNIPILAFYEIRFDSAIYRICRNVIFIIIPVLVITISNILILYNISKSYRNRRNLTANFMNYNENQNNENWMSQAKIFLVSFAFIFLNMPVCVSRILSDSFFVDQKIILNFFTYINRNNDQSFYFSTLAYERFLIAAPCYILWNNITLQILSINFSINFLLYCVSGNNFRKKLVDMFKKSVNHLQNCFVHITNR